MKNKRDHPLTDFDNLSAEEWAKLLSETIDIAALQLWLEPLAKGSDKFAGRAAKIDLSEGWFIRGKKRELHKGTSKNIPLWCDDRRSSSQRGRSFNPWPLIEAA